MTRVILTAWVLLAIAGCAHSRGDVAAPSDGGAAGLVVSDAWLRLAAEKRTSWVFYRNDSGLLSRALGSGHTEPQLRTQYNPIAATQLDATGRVRAGASFPDSAIIVKELHGGGALNTLAVMMKLRGSPQASPGGWVWGYFDGTGGVRISVNERGGSCAGCHSAGIDYTRMNDSHR
jgi:hypothetical protein